MPYTPPTPADARAIRDVDVAFASTKHLPEWDDIPAEFKGRNRYTVLVDALFARRFVPSTPLPDYDITLVDGLDPKDLNRLVEAHLESRAPKHEHKVAGVAYMLSFLCTLSEPNEAMQ